MALIKPADQAGSAFSGAPVEHDVHTGIADNSGAPSYVSPDLNGPARARAFFEGTVDPQLRSSRERALSETKRLADRPTDSPPLRAFRLLHHGHLAGFLGEGPGPFLSKRHEGPPPEMKVARFTSEDPSCEVELSRAIDNAKSFASLLKALHRRGYEMTSVAYAEVFAPTDSGPGSTPDQRA
jgi:hypothetical protein